MGRPGTFAKGNKAAVGNPGPSPRKKIVTDVIIAKLHEIQRSGTYKDRELVWKLVDELFEHATSKYVTVKDSKGKPLKDKEGKVVKEKVLGDLSAMIHIFDRAEGKATQKIGTDGEDGSGITILFSKDAAGVL